MEKKDPRLKKEVDGWKKTLDLQMKRLARKILLRNCIKGKLYEVELAPEQDEHLLWISR